MNNVVRFYPRNIQECIARGITQYESWPLPVKVERVSKEQLRKYVGWMG